MCIDFSFDSNFVGKKTNHIIPMLCLMHYIFCSALQVLPEYGSGSGTILMDDVVCSSNAISILDCSYITNHNCIHAEDVGVICKH